MSAQAMRKFEENPFFVLGIGPQSPRDEIERAAQKLLGLLELGAASATTYQTPLGPRKRTQELVRQAVAQLRDGAARLEAEVWASTMVTEGTSAPAPQAGPETDADALFREAGFLR